LGPVGGGGDNVKKGIEGEGGDSKEMEGEVRKVPKVQGADRSLPETRQKWILKTVSKINTA
jgi:hypothetical protein